MNRLAAIFVSLATVMLVSAIGLAAAKEDAKPQEAPILQQWQGPYPVKQVNLLPAGQQGTPTGFINDAKTFAAVWKAWKGGEKAPAVDFQKNLVVFSRNTQYLNVVNIFKVLLKDGVAEVLAMETMSAIADRRQGPHGPGRDRARRRQVRQVRRGHGDRAAARGGQEPAKEPAKELPKAAA